MDWLDLHLAGLDLIRRKKMDYGTQKRSLLFLCNQNRKRQCFARSPSAGNGGTTGIMLEKESDRKRGKTRVNRRAFTRWRAPVFCQNLFPHYYTSPLTTGT